MHTSGKVYTDDGSFRVSLPAHMERSIKAQLRDNKNAKFAAIKEMESGDKNVTLSYLWEKEPIASITEAFNVDAQKLVEIRGAYPISIVSCIECQVHLPDDSPAVFRQQLRTLGFLGRFDTGVLVERDRLYELMCSTCADDYRDCHAEQLRANFLTRKARLAEIRRAANRSVEEYYKTPEWGARSNGAKIRAGNRCQACGRSDVQLETHHNTYERLGEELPVDLVVLCRDCHQMYHDHRDLPGAA